MNKRIYVRKKEAYQNEAKQLLTKLNETYHLQLDTLTIYNIYDIFNIDVETYEKAKYSVFAEKMIDEVFEEMVLEEGKYFAYETLPSQYDQRADSAMQCIRLLNDQAHCTVKTGRLFIFNKVLTEKQLLQIEQYIVNPIEARVKQMGILQQHHFSDVKPLKDLTGFNEASDELLLHFKQDLSLAMDLQDLKFIQQYFIGEKRTPTETEIYVLDCYWSDHCRHTTFETILDDIQIASTLFQQEMQEAFESYLTFKKACGNTKPITLMDMASIIGKYHKNVLKDENIEVSDEINACSFFTTIQNEGKKEKWLIQFKNETHNHPTEIEPFGGASTCIGGAIRDPLSGRSYVYQAMRVSGCGNVLQKREATLNHKLPQSVIAKGAAHGYSSYGNQIGLATTHVKELYDDSYVAKHMEVGAVVGAVKEGNYKRESVTTGDIVIVIGGRTGRDGIQGASGSSVVHTNDSLVASSSQVQKGNAPEERKIQRLFRNPAVTNLIKKCNDFGAGGVCVAIGELARGIEIHLDKVLLKYEGLNATEIATSESQERMAVVIDPKDYDLFTKHCKYENIEFSHVATITNRNRLEMYYFDEKVVDMKADFLETSGVKQHATAILKDNLKNNPFEKVVFTKEHALTELASLNVTSQKGLVEMFDSTIGVTTVLMPFSGKHQITPVQASVQALPTLHTTSDTATILTYGFIPKIAHYSPFLSAIYAVLESVAKVYAVGGSKENLYFSFQEYFEKLGQNPEKWGKVTQSLLGTIYAQKAIGRPSIGGKDSMSGTFNDLNVVETLISFACTPVKIANVITPEFKQTGNYIYFVPVEKNENHYPNIEKTLENYAIIEKHIANQTVVSAYVQEAGSVFSSLVKMSLGNNIGVHVNMENILDFVPASMVVESTVELPFEYIGKTSETFIVNGQHFEFEELYHTYTATLNTLYPMYDRLALTNCENITTPSTQKMYYPSYVENVEVVIPVFPGTNCEYDSARAFIEAGAHPNIVVIRNTTENDIEASIHEFVQQIKKSHIIMLPGGFSSGDEPDGSAKFIVNVLRNEKVKNAIHEHLAQKKLILGICNGFQALIKCGLLPYGKITEMKETDLTLYHNDCQRHVSTTAFTRVCNQKSAWTQDFEVGEMHEVIFSHGEGKIVGESIETFKHLAAFQYCDFEGNATLNGRFNPNGSLYAIEGLVSPCGLILGKMGHSERDHASLYKTKTLHKKQTIFSSGVAYFKNK